MQNHPVAVFWDYGTTPLKRGLLGRQVAGALRDVGMKYGVIKSFRAYIDYDNQRPVSFGTLRRELHSSGVSLVDCPSSQKDLADKAIIVDMMTLAWDNPPPYTIVLVTNDNDLSYALAILRFRGYKTVIICPSDSDSLINQSDSVVDWNRDILGLGEEGDDDTSSTSSKSSEDSEHPPLDHGLSRRDSGPSHAVALADTPDPIEIKPAVNSSPSRITPGDEQKPQRDTLSKDSLFRASSRPEATEGVPTNRNSVLQATLQRTQAEDRTPKDPDPADSGRSPFSTISPAPPIADNQSSLFPHQGSGSSRERAKSLSFFPPPPAFPLDPTPLVPDFQSIVNRDPTNQENDGQISSAGSQSSGYSLISQPTNGTSSRVPEKLVASSPPALPHSVGTAGVPPRHNSPPPRVPKPIEPTTIEPGPSNRQAPVSGTPNPRPVTPAGSSNAAPTPGPSSNPTQAPINRILPDRYRILVQRLQHHHRQGRDVVDISMMAIEVTPAYWKGTLGYSKFKKYAASAAQHGIITLVSNNHISLRPEWYDVDVS